MAMIKSGQPSNVESFFTDKSILVTGTTGTVGKVVIEKLLNSCNGIKAIYVLVEPAKGKSLQATLDRVLADKLFDNVKGQSDTMKKLIPLSGNVIQHNLGLTDNDMEKVCGEVTIVFNTAETLKHHETLKKCLDVNVNGTKNVMELCERIQSLTALVHLSSAFACCLSERIDERIYETDTNADKLMEMTKNLSKREFDIVMPQLISEWPNAYAYTKALAEMIVAQKASPKIPTVVMRPTFIGAAWSKSIGRGWTDNLNGFTGLIYMAAKNYLRTGWIDDVADFDLVPVDFVANACIGAAWLMSTEPSKSLQVYNLTSANSNSIKFRKAFEMNMIYIQSNPPLAIARPPIHLYRYFPRKHYIVNRYTYDKFLYQTAFAYWVDPLRTLLGRKPKWMEITKKINRTQKMVDWVCDHHYKWDDGNVKNLIERLSPVDKQTFNMDIRLVQYKEWFEESWMWMRRYLMKEDPKNMNSAILKSKLYWYGWMFQEFSIFTATMYLIYNYIPIKEIIRYIIFAITDALELRE